MLHSERARERERNKNTESQAEPVHHLKVKFHMRSNPVFLNVKFTDSPEKKTHNNSSSSSSGNNNNIDERTGEGSLESE